MYTVNKQKLSERKVLQSTGFYSSLEKTFMVIASTVLKVLPSLKALIGKTIALVKNPRKLEKFSLT